MKALLARIAPRGQPAARLPVDVQEIAWFLFVGGTSAAVFMSLGVFFTSVCGLRPSLSIVATLLIVVPPTYLAQRRLTFRSGRTHLAAFPRYVATQLVANVLAIVGSELFQSEIRQQPWLGFFFVAACVAATSYILLKLWAFR